MPRSNLPGTRKIVASDGFGIFGQPYSPRFKPVSSSAGAKTVGTVGPNLNPSGPLTPYVTYPPSNHTGAVTAGP